MHTISTVKLANTRAIDQILANVFSPEDFKQAEITDLIKASLQQRLTVDVRLKAYMDRWDLKPQQKRKIAQLMGWPGFAKQKGAKRSNLYCDSAANTSAWFANMVFLINEFYRLSKKREIQFYMLTLVDQAWNFGDKYTTIDWHHIKKKSTRALETIGVEGVAVLEFQAVTNEYFGDAGRLMLPNVHAIIWRKDGKEFNYRKAQDDLCKTFKGKGASEGALIKPVVENEGGLMGAITYITKPIDSGKRGVRRPDGTSYMVPSKVHFRKNQSLRIMEILSCFKHKSLIFGRGEGAMLKRAALAAASSQQPKDWVEVDNIPKLWARARERAGKAAFMPVRILRNP